MSFRSRILVACLFAALVPLLLFALGARREVHQRSALQFEERSDEAAVRLRLELTARAAGIDARLAALAVRLTEEPQLRAAMLQSTDAAVLLDYAPRVMPAAGLDFLQLVDGNSTVRSSGHFRADHSRRSQLHRRVRNSEEPVVVQARRADGSFLVLARAHEFRLAGATLTLVGGTRIDDAFVHSLLADGEPHTTIRLDYPGGTIGARPAEAETGAARTYAFESAFLDDAGAGDAEDVASWTVRQSLAPLLALQRSMDAWLLAALAAAVLLAWIVARVLAERVNRPLEELARRSRRVNLERLDVAFSTRRTDEIGTLSRLLDAMVERLRAAAAAVRTAERRATVGDMAAQVNHDIRNGLLPMRNVVRHLEEVSAAAPAELPAVFAERASTLRSGIQYLESLATNYARLTLQPQRQEVDVNTVVRASIGEFAAGADTRVRLELGAGPLNVMADPVALRRVLENLTVNAIESIDATGSVIVSTARNTAGDGRTIAIVVTDNGVGIEEADIDRIFDDFYTTRANGTGLGLSIVRRLVTDMGGRIRVDSRPGRGTTFRIELPETE